MSSSPVSDFADPAVAPPSNRKAPSPCDHEPSQPLPPLPAHSSTPAPAPAPAPAAAAVKPISAAATTVLGKRVLGLGLGRAEGRGEGPGVALSAAACWERITVFGCVRVRGGGLGLGLGRSWSGGRGWGGCREGVRVAACVCRSVLREMCITISGAFYCGLYVVCRGRRTRGCMGT